ncbi:unnamed protein product [Schistocephalus solidus]|uniref:Uncharacterized protein n=1 Tax=Schistocephalus solidus TaxID=70667 RepID=A0A183TQA3_SCHSO|nr:unnamed protein product [Schistocephalus solidus]
MLQQRLKLMEALTVKLSNSSMGQSNITYGSQSIDHTAGSITEFLYDPQVIINFYSWYKRSIWLLRTMRLLLRKQGPAYGN